MILDMILVSPLIPLSFSVGTILFGEWLYAQHSISYSNLPDYFLAFDLYNKKKKLFYNRDILLYIVY